MTQCLVDVNVWLALLRLEHTHHRSATDWYSRLVPGQACLCRLVQLSLVRLLGNPTIMAADALPAAGAWRIIQELLEDERVEFLPEPEDLDSILAALFRYPNPTRSLINDAYLAAFAIASSRRLVTLDRGFEQFRGLDLEILSS
jgi:toxin-antitoxin system PIN domain toxin